MVDHAPRSSSHAPGTPFSVRAPRDANASPEPATRSLDGLRHEHLAGPASAVDARGDVDGHAGDFVVRHSHLARCARRRESRCPRSPTASTIASAQRIARAGPVEGGEEAVAGGVDLAPAEAREGSADDRAVVARARSLHCRSPSSAARAVEPTMSVNSTVASTRSGSGCRAPAVRNSSIASTSSIDVAGRDSNVVRGPARLDVAGAGDVLGDVAGVARVDAVRRRARARASARGCSGRTRAHVCWSIVRIVSRTDAAGEVERRSIRPYHSTKARVMPASDGASRSAVAPSPQCLSGHLGELGALARRRRPHG